MATIDKIVVQYEAEVKQFKEQLDEIKKQLKLVEKTANDAAKKTEKGFDDVGKGANDLKETIKGLGQQIAAAFAAREIIRFTKQTIDAASDLNETLSKSQQIFGDASKAVEEFASNSAKQFGMSKQTAIDAAASFGVFGKSAGLTGKDLSTFSTDLVALSADLASFGNTTPEEAALALGAALRGEAEPIRRFGVLLDDATLRQEALSMGLIKTTKEALTPQQKVLAANAAILKQTADAQGDFARTSEGAANQQRILEATFKDLQTEIGQKLLPTFNSALSTLNNFLGDLDADDVMSFAKAIGVAATAFGAFKVGNLIKDMGGLAGMLKATTGGVQGLSKAVMANPFGLIATAVATLIAYGPDLLDMFNGVNETQKELEEVAYKATEGLRKEQAELNLLAESLRKTNPGSEERARLLERFNELSPQGIADLKDTANLNQELSKTMKLANDQYDARIKKIGLEAATAAASQKQISLKAKITAEEDKMVRETGMTYDEARKKVREYIEYQKTGAFPAFARLKGFLQGSVKDLAELQYEYDNTTAELTKLKTENQNFAALTNENTKATNQNANATENNTKKTEKAKTAIELAQEAISKLRSEAELLAYQGDWIGAKRKTEQADLLQKKLDAVKETIESINKDVDVTKLGILPLPQNQGVTQDNIFELMDIPDTMGIKVNIDVDEDSVMSAEERLAIFSKQAEDLAGGLSKLGSGFGEMVSAFAAVSGENAEYVKSLAIVQVGIQTAAAIASAIAGATSAAATTGPGAPFVLAGYIASMIGTVVGAFAQVNQLLTAEVPKPGFFEGTPYLQLGGNPSGKDTIPVMAHEGEAIIPTSKNLKYPGLAKSWINGNLDSYIHNQFVRPALIDQQQKAEEDFADRLAASMALQMSSQFDDYRLHRDLKEQTAVLRNGFYHMKETRKKIRGGR